MCRQDALLTAARALEIIRPERIAARQEAPIPPDEFDRFPKPSDNRTRLREIRKDWKRDDGTPLRPEPRLPAEAGCGSLGPGTGGVSARPPAAAPRQASQSVYGFHLTISGKKRTGAGCASYVLM